MKILKAVMIVVGLFIVPTYAFSANLGYMRISLIAGDVQIKTPGADDWGMASINSPVGEGDQVWAPQGGRVELQLNSGTYIRLDQNSALQILSMDRDSSQFYLSQGYAYIYYGAPGGSVIQIDTPDASTRVFDKAIFRIDMSEQYTDVAVYKGYVDTENRVGTTGINAGQMVSLGQNTDGELAPMGPPDDWETWNKTRNNRIFARRGASSRYLPAELRAYSYDFDNSGRWVRVPAYGYVWTPTVVVGASWSPYRDGRWIWRGDDYVWVAFEPWGWAPYHYGRWSFDVNIGWFWIPPVVGEVYWSPGYVGWVRTENYVAWVPLAPGEIYYGRGDYGRNSVNITNVNISQANITTVYKNVNVNNGVTVVNSNTFATASPRIVNVNQSVIQQQLFTRNNISIGTPAIKPTSASYFSSTRSVPAAKLPPPAVRNVQNTQLKQSRPFIKEADKSVLNLGIKPKTLPVNTVTTPRTPGKGKSIQQQGKPAERVKPTAPEGGPTGRGEQQQVKPDEKGTAAVPQGAPTGRGEQQQVKPDEKGKAAVPQGGPAGRGERQQVQPAERVKPTAPEGGPTGRGEQQQVKPDEKGKAAVPQGGPAGRGERQQVQPAERVKPSGPAVSPAGRGEQQQVKPDEKGKAAVPKGGPADKGEKQQVKPDKKGKPGVAECGPGQKDEKNPEKCPQKDKKKGKEEPER